MLRPATPLAVLLFIAFALQVLTVISTPIAKPIFISSFNGFNYGVFGFCQGDTCTGPGIGYPQATDPNTGPLIDNGFTLSSALTRRALSDILIVHPVAAVFSLVVFILSLAAHFHGPSHSTRFLLAVIILMLPTFVLSLLCFLIDILLFIPHPGMGVWLMLAATLIIAVSSVLMCAMRRTLVSRKSRKDRVANNAEMSGENFYARQAATGRAASPPPLAHDHAGPMVNGAPGADTLPSFANYDSTKRISNDDDRLPLDPNSGMAPVLGGDGMERYGGGRGGMMTQGRGGRGYGPPRDQYGSSQPPSYSYNAPGRGGSGVASPYGSAAYSSDTLSTQASRGMGRGGYPQGRGGYGRGGPYGGRGGPGLPSGPAAMIAGRGQQRSSEDGYGRGTPGPYGQGYPNGPSPYGRRPSDPRYPRGQSPGTPARGGPGYGYGPPRTTSHDTLPRAESPPPLPGEEHMVDPTAIGQAIEMTPAIGSPVQSSAPYMQASHPLSDSEDEMDEYAHHQQSARTGPQISPSSAYSSQRNDSYGTARHWHDARHEPPPALPTEISRPGSARSPRIQTAHIPEPQRARVGSGDNYLEDVDPRFAHDDAVSPPPLSTGLPMPTSLMPGTATLPLPRPHPMEQQHSYDSTHDGPESEASDFTSISQRGVNPRWQPEPPGYGYGGVPNRRPNPPRDFGLSGNPDFELSGAGPNRRGGRGMGR